MSFDRRWLDEQGSEDCQGRALWALGIGVGRSPFRSFQMMAGQLFAQALPALTEFTSPRAWAFGLIGIHEYLRRLSGDSLVNQTRETLTCRLMDLFEASAQPDWRWFEEELSYDNAKLAHALILSGHATGQPAVLERGLQALRWLNEVADLREGPLPADRQQRLLPPRRHARQFRPAAHRGAGHGLGLSGSLSRHLGRLVVRTGATRLRLVHRLERSRPGTLLSRDRRLPRWIACGSGQREPGSGIHSGLPAFLGGNAPGAKHGDEFQRTDRRSRSSRQTPISIHLKRTATILKPDQSRVLLRPFNPGRLASGSARIIARIMSLPEDQVGPLLDEISAEFSQRHQQIRKLFLERFEQVRESLPTDRGALRTKTAVDRLLFPGRILSGIRCAVQSIHRAAPRPDRSAARRSAVHSQPARHRRRTHFFHHFSNRHHPSRSADRGVTRHGLPHRASPDPKPRVREGAVRAETL